MKTDYSDDIAWSKGILADASALDGLEITNNDDYWILGFARDIELGHQNQDEVDELRTELNKAIAPVVKRFQRIQARKVLESLKGAKP